MGAIGLKRRSEARSRRERCAPAGVDRLGFLALVGAEFCSALNDNLFKMVVSVLSIGASLAGGGGSAILSLAGAVYMLPYLLFAPLAGRVADRFDKRAVLIVAKTAEIAVMVLALAALVAGRIAPLLAILFLAALLATFSSPARYGILPEILPAATLSRANGLLQMARYLAVVLGSGAGGAALALWSDRPLRLGLVLIGLAIAGSVMSFRIASVPDSGAASDRSASRGSLLAGLRRVAKDESLGPAVAGLTLLDFLGTLVMLDMLLLSKETLRLGDGLTGLLAAFAGLGIGLGSFLAGRLSRDRIDLRLSLLGGVGGALALVLLFLASHSFLWAAAALVAIGAAGGFMSVPLYALVQHKAGAREKGRLIATSNFINMAGVLCASGALWLLRDLCGLAADRIILAAAAVQLGAVLLLMRHWRGADARTGLDPTS